MESLLLLTFPLASFILTLVLVPLVRRVGLQYGWVDEPVGGRKIHRRQVVRSGGLAIWLSAAVGAGVWLWLVEESVFSQAGWQVPSFLYVMGGATLIAALGFYDDVQPCPAWVKASAQVAAALLVVHAGLVPQGMVNPFTGEYLAFGLFGDVFTVFWVLLFTNAINLIDGMDGLAAGVVAIGLTALSATGFLPQPALILALVLIGALFGFLRYNSAPATVFMGDVGSTFVGYVVAALSLMAMASKPTMNGLIAPVLIFGFPVLDTFLAFTRRLLTGRHPFHPDAEHLHHRLFRLLGRVQARAVWAVYMIAMVLGVLGYTVAFTDPRTALFVTMGVLLLGLALLVLLDYLRPSGDEPFLQQPSAEPARRLLLPAAFPAPVLNLPEQAVLNAVLNADLDAPEPTNAPDESWEPLVEDPPTARPAPKRPLEVPVTWVSLSVMTE